MRIQSERPIKDKSEDILKRSRFAINVAKKINNYEYIESITIGLMGSWGSGKSSIINMIKKEIDESKLIIVDFNPWYFAGRKQLISDFFEVLSNHIGDNKNDIQELGKDLKLYSAALKPLTLIPQIGSMLSIICKVTETGGSFLNEYYKAQNEDISKVKKRINTQIREYDKKIVVIIDEIDRLENDDIKEMFQLVRALGDFDNMVYLLSFDKEKVCEAFSSGEEYLDKIINVPLYVPEISMKNINDYFINELENIFNNKAEIDSKYWQEIYRYVFENKFESLREVKRFLNIVRFNCDDIIKDLNIVDYLVINFLKMFDEECYRFIKENKQTLVNIDSREKLDKLLNSVDVRTKKNIDLKKLINLIFYQYRISQRRAIRNSNYFDSYFQHSLKDDIFTFSEIDKYSFFTKKEDLILALKDMEKENLLIFFRNLDDISEKLKKEQIYFYEEVLVKKVLLLNRKQNYTFAQESEQSIAFVYLKNMVMRLGKNDESIINLIDKLEFSKSYEVDCFLQYLLELKKYFIVDGFKEKLLEKLNEYIYSFEYGDEIRRNFGALNKLEFNVEEYIRSIVSNENAVITYLQSLIKVVEVGYDNIYNEYGEIVGQEEFCEEVIILEDISDYINYDYIKEKVDALSEVCRRENDNLISKFYNSRPYDEVYARFIEEQQWEEENI